VVTTGQRLLSLVLMMPFYYSILMVVGTVFGKYHYVKTMAMRPVVMLRQKFGGQQASVKKKD
jgi:hypothetical protein